MVTVLTYSQEPRISPPAEKIDRSHIDESILADKHTVAMSLHTFLLFCIVKENDRLKTLLWPHNLMQPSFKLKPSVVPIQD